MKRYHFYFSGQVQGVGFRFAMWQLATALHLSGWVKNKSDGRVEAEVQGDPLAIETLIRQMKSIPYIQIDSIAQSPMALKTWTPFEMLRD